MADIAVMLIIVLFMAFLAIYKANIHSEGNSGFFNEKNSRAMRGIWCIVIILVHTPEVYQNTIQDMIGSFAYIGVTFFFMTSAYGLTLSAVKKPQSINLFWRRRLPKLLVPIFLTNLLFALLTAVLFRERIGFDSLLDINSWVKWLLACYLIFWLVYVCIKNEKYRSAILIAAIALFSLVSYFLQKRGIIAAAWTTEVYGFAWGIILALLYDKVVRFAKDKWLMKCAVCAVLALLLGISYLKFKSVTFVGDYALKIILGAAIICLILLLNTRVSLGNKIVLFLGEISFEIYLVHGSVFNAVARMSEQLGSGVYILVCILLTVAISAGIHYASSFILKHVYSIPWMANRKAIKE